MNWLGNVLREIGEAVFLMFNAIGQIRYAARNRDKVIAHVLEIGNASLPMVVILSVFIGGVLSLQTGYALASTGLQSRLGVIVGLSVARELGPVMMAVLLVFRIGIFVSGESMKRPFGFVLLGAYAVYMVISYMAPGDAASM